MLKIRLQRIGKRGQAYFRVVVTEHTKKPQGKYLELLGSYDPHKNELSVDGEKVKHWISKGAKLSETANNLLVDRGVIEGEKVRVWKPKKKSQTEKATQPVAPEQKPKQQTETPPEKVEEAKEEKPEVQAKEIQPEKSKEEQKEEEKDEKAAKETASAATAS